MADVEVTGTARSPAAILFDFDGTIVDTEWPVFESIRREFHRVGHDLSETEWRSIIGTDTDLDWLGRLRAVLGAAFDEETIEARRRATRDELLELERLRPGVVDTITTARRRGLRLAVASSSPRVWVEAHLRRVELWDRFAAVVTRDDVARAKPAPDLFLAAAAQLSVDAGDCVAIEDSVHGCVAAKAAGARVIAVPNRMTAGGDFSAADLVVESLGDPAVSSFLGWPDPSLHSAP